MTKEERIEINSSFNELTINTFPYKSNYYFFISIGYFLLLFFYTLCYLYKDILFFENDLPKIINYFNLIIICSTALFFIIDALHLLPSILKNSFIKNLLLKENLTVRREEIEYRNNLGKRINYNLKDIGSIYFEFNKPFSEYSGIPRFIPNYSPTIFLKNHKGDILEKLMYSIKKEDTKAVYKEIILFIINQELFFYEQDVKYTDKINKIYHSGKLIEFVSLYDSIDINYKLFTHEEKSNYFKTINLNKEFDRKLSKDLISKLLDKYNNQE